VRRMVASFGVLLAACGGLEPGELAGTYGLTAVEGGSPPYLLVATVECDSWLTGGTLTLAAGGAFVLDLVEQHDCSRGGGTPFESHREYPGTFALDGSVLRFVSPLHPAGELAFEGRVDDERVTVEVPDLAPRSGPTLTLTLDRDRGP
jgi:hypothetical protein